MQGIIGFISDFNTIINLFWTDYKKKTTYYYTMPKVSNRYSGYSFYKYGNRYYSLGKYEKNWLKKF
jgi:hypothetical protein